MSNPSDDQKQLLESDFECIVRHAPLVSIDIVVRSPDGHVWLGLRNEQPAQHTWFVPGGRIRKDESVADAFARITRSELHTEVSIDRARYLGTFEHLYPGDNRFAKPDFSTRYFVLAYEVALAEPLQAQPDRHHCQQRWWPVAELLAAPAVHENTKAYFVANPKTAIPGWVKG